MTELNHILDDSNFTHDEKLWIKKFADEIKKKVTHYGIYADISMFDIADAIGLDLSTIHKEGPLMYALWVAMLVILKKFYKRDDFKYPTLDSFHHAYNYVFDEESDEEQERLWQTANWMSVLFQLISAKKNKGLAMQVVPKLVEGWQAKYVTGSGQTRLTANRVLIFEREGNTKANHRGKVKPKKKSLPKRYSTTHRGPGRKRSKSPSTVALDEDELTITTTSVGKKRGRSNSTSSIESLPISPATRSSSITTKKTTPGKRGRRPKAKPISKKSLASTRSDASNTSPEPSNVQDATDVDEDDSTMNEEVHQAFNLWREQSASAPVLDVAACDLMRSHSLFESTPSQLQRGVSWTEIPLSTESNINNASSTSNHNGGTHGSGIHGDGKSGLFSPLITHLSEPVFSLSQPMDIGLGVASSMSPPPPMRPSSYSESSCSANDLLSINPSLEPKAIRDIFNGYTTIANF
jgi:hypothetical protein